MITLVIGGYWLFYFQKPRMEMEISGTTLYLETIFAAFASIIFFSAVAVTFVNLFHNLWAGIGAGILLWLVINSTFGSKLPSWINIFAYGNKNLLENDSRWILGKLSGIVISMILILLNKKLISLRRMKQENRGKAREV